MNLPRFTHLAAACAAFAGLCAAPAAFAQEVIKIGLSSPLSGGQSANGQDNLAGARLAADEINAKKPSVAGKAVRFEIVAEDDQADPRQGVAAAQKMTDSGIKFVVGPYNSGVTMPASRVYDQVGTVVTTVSSNLKITE